MPMHASSSTVQAGSYVDNLSLCTGIKCGNHPGGVSICQSEKNVPTNQYTNGFVATATFSGDPGKNQLVLTYTGDNATIPGGDIKQRKTSISLICKEDASSDVFTVSGETPTGQVNYRFTLTSKHACIIPNPGLSAGSVLLILFFVFVLVYLIGGILFLRFYRGANGKEMIPNFEFWKDFPFLVKDGMMFTFRGCKTDTTYTQI